MDQREQVEIWKDIEGYEGLYRVSNLGRIKSLDRMVWGGKAYYFKKGRILKQTIKIKKTGYKSKVIGLSKNGNHKTFRAHRIVAKAFIKNINNKPDINHIDGNSINNNVTNLEWCTPKENTFHAITHGLITTTKIPEEILKDLYINKHYSINKLSKKFNVNRMKISKALKENNINIRGIYNFDKKILIEQAKKYGYRGTARLYGCSHSTIINFLK